MSPVRSQSLRPWAGPRLRRPAAEAAPAPSSCSLGALTRGPCLRGQNTADMNAGSLCYCTSWRLMYALIVCYTSWHLMYALILCSTSWHLMYALIVCYMSWHLMYALIPCSTSWQLMYALIVCCTSWHLMSTLIVCFTYVFFFNRKSVCD